MQFTDPEPGTVQSYLPLLGTSPTIARIGFSSVKGNGDAYIAFDTGCFPGYRHDITPVPRRPLSWPRNEQMIRYSILAGTNRAHIVAIKLPVEVDGGAAEMDVPCVVRSIGAGSRRPVTGRLGIREIGRIDTGAIMCQNRQCYSAL
jgi:hypothetical protein